MGTITVAARTVDGFSLTPFAANIPGVVALAFVDDELYVVTSSPAPLPSSATPTSRTASRSCNSMQRPSSAPHRSPCT
ncbi:MAG: hypothetical protein R2851_20660 [Caldilineaceae bacterium]